MEQERFESGAVVVESTPFPCLTKGGARFRREKLLATDGSMRLRIIDTVHGKYGVVDITAIAGDDAAIARVAADVELQISQHIERK